MAVHSLAKASMIFTSPNIGDSVYRAAPVDTIAAMSYPPQPPRGAQPPYQPQSPYLQRRKTNRFAIASLVLGIASLLSIPIIIAYIFDYGHIIEKGAAFYLAIFGLPGIIFGLLGIIFGIVALKRPAVKGGQQGGRGMAIAGIVVGGALLLICLIFSSAITFGLHPSIYFHRYPYAFVGRLPGKADAGI